MIGLTNKKPGGGVLDTYSYQYDTSHNQTQKTDPKGTTQYQYDSLNRLNYVLEPASLAGKLTQYTYDHAGNRLTETVSETDGATQKQKSTVTKYNYNEQNRLMTTEVTNEAGAKSVTKYVYDANGNLTAKSMETTKPYDPNTKPSFGMFIIGQDTSNLRPEIQAIAKSTAMYEYDHYNQLAVAKTSGGTSVYKYNGDGLRVEKEVNGTTTKYLYEYDKVVLELDGNGKEIGRNIYGTNLISKEVDGQKLSYMYNGHADVTSLIDGTGEVKNTYYYDAFGNVKEETGTAKNNITYAGYQYDKETGLYYLNSRMYDPVTARFMQEDTYRGQANDPLSLNLYTYCHNEPMMYTDPTGHDRFSSKEMKNMLKKQNKPSDDPRTDRNIMKDEKKAADNKKKKEDDDKKKRDEEDKKREENRKADLAKKDKNKVNPGDNRGGGNIKSSNDVGKNGGSSEENWGKDGYDYTDYKNGKVKMGNLSASANIKLDKNGLECGPEVEVSLAKIEANSKVIGNKYVNVQVKGDAKIVTLGAKFDGSMNTKKVAFGGAVQAQGVTGEAEIDVEVLGQKVSLKGHVSTLAAEAGKEFYVDFSKGKLKYRSQAGFGWFGRGVEININ